MKKQVCKYSKENTAKEKLRGFIAFPDIKTNHKVLFLYGTKVPSQMKF